jgi:class 3 adenylate cyclase
MRLYAIGLYSTRGGAEVPETPVERKLAAIFAADIAGYSRLMARDEVGTLARLKACRVIIDELIASHRGRIFNTAGDSVVADLPARSMPCSARSQSRRHLRWRARGSRPPSRCNSASACMSAT